MYIFGINIPILELLVVFCIIVVIYLILLEFEFRQLRKIANKFETEESELAKEIRQLKKEIKSISGKKRK